MLRCCFLASLLLSMLLLPPAAVAQSNSSHCTGCYLGVYDDQGLSVNFGFWDASTNPVKEIWVGILYEAWVPSEMQAITGIELSVEGLIRGPFGDPAFEGIPVPSVVIGNTLTTPEDSTGTGGINMAWNSCLPGNRAMVRIQMLSLTPVGNDIVITVRRKYPPSSRANPFPLYTQCNDPEFTATRVNGGCYVLNPSVEPGESVGGCKLTSTVAAENTSWTTIKSLYRD